jgi:hypothetical protein
MLSGWKLLKKVDVLRKLVEIFQQANLSEHISGELSLLRQQCDEFTLKKGCAV